MDNLSSLIRGKIVKGVFDFLFILYNLINRGSMVLKSKINPHHKICPCHREIIIVYDQVSP